MHTPSWPQTLFQMKRVKVRCPANGASGEVVFFPDTDDAELFRSLCAAVSLYEDDRPEFYEDLSGDDFLNIFGSPRKKVRPCSLYQG